MEEGQKETIKKSNVDNKSWNSKQALIVSLLAYFVAQIFVSIPIIAFGVINGEEALNEDFLGQSWVSLMLTGVSALGLTTTLLLFFRYKHINIKKLGFRRPNFNFLKYIPLAYVVYVFSLGIIIGVLSGLFPEFNPDEVQDVGFIDATAGWQLALAFIGLVVIAPIAEEMLFRGFLYKGLKNHPNLRIILYFGLAISVFAVISFGALAGFIIAAITIYSAILIRTKPKLGAALFSSMLFGLVHLQWNVAVDTFILSFALVWVLEKTGNLWAPIFLHSLKNFVAFVFVFGIISIPGA